MITPHSLALDFGQLHFGSASLGDQRRTRRLVASANRICGHPAETFPAKFQSPADLEAFYDLMNSKHVTHERVLAPHRALTLQRMQAHPGVVLIVHDATELDYTGKRSLKDLGTIGNGKGRGYICQNSLAIDGDAREVLGLVHQVLHKRAQVPQGEGVAAKRARQDRESRLWLEGLAAVGPAPEGKVWVDVCDRGADSFEFLEAASHSGRSFVVRSSSSRAITLGHPLGGDKAKLHAYGRSLSLGSSWEVQAPARPIRVKGKKRQRSKTSAAWPLRTATVAVGFAPVLVQAPHVRRGEHGRTPLALWLVVVREVDPPPGMEPVEWFLLTNRPVSNDSEARAIVGWYSLRWIVEEYHKAQKTGCGIENPQFTTEAALQPAIALLSVVAVFLLNLREAARRPDAAQRRAQEVVPALAVEVLSCWRCQEHRPDWSVHEFYQALARLGGHQNRKGDHPPGWLVLWRGWQELQTMMTAVRAIRRKKRCP